MTKKHPTMPKTSIRKKLKAGDYFAVPLENGEYGLGQILDIHELVPGVACILFDKKFLLNTPISIDEKNIISAVYIVEGLLKRYFPIIQTNNIEFNGNDLLHKYFPYTEQYHQGNTTGMTTSQTGIIEMFLNAYFGLTPWDECYDPHFYDDMLVSPDKKPSNLIYSK